MTLQSKYPKLRNLIAAYFHQDWKYDYDWSNYPLAFEPVVRFFKMHNPLETTDQATRELKEFLALSFNEEQLESVLDDEFGLCLRPEYFKLTHEQWLKKVLEVLEEPMEKTKQKFIPTFIS